jgi:hypothetical protein
MVELDFSKIPVRADGTRWLSGLSIPESIAINSIYGRTPPELKREDYLLKGFVARLSDHQKKIILASSTKPKNWSSVLRHAKVKPQCVMIGRSLYSRPSFRSRDFTLLYNSDTDGRYRLTSAGKLVQDYIKAEIKRG